MEPQQYTIQILDKDESTDLVTSKQSCLIGRSLISDIRIHLPSVREMHLEIDMKNKRVTAYGQDVKVNGVDVGVNMTVDYEYGDVVSLRNKRFVVHKNKEHREGKGLPLVVSTENAFGDQALPPATSLKGRFNMSPNRPRRSEDTAPVLSEATEGMSPVDDARSTLLQEQDTMHEEKETLPEDDAEKSMRPSFFNATDSSIDNIIAREKQIVDSEIKNNIEFDVSVLQTSISANSTKPMDLKEAVLEKAVLDDIIEGKQDAVDMRRTVRDLADKGELPREADVGTFDEKDSSKEEGAGETESCIGFADTAELVGNSPANTIKVRNEVLLVTEKVISVSKEIPPLFETGLFETSIEAVESKAAAEPQPREETQHDDGQHMISEELKEQKNVAPKDDPVCLDVNSDSIHSVDHQDTLERSEEKVPAGDSGAEVRNDVAEVSAKRGSVNNNLAEKTPREESEMAIAKYSSTSRRVENLVDSLSKEEERRAKMGVLAKKSRPADGTSMKSEAPQKKASIQKNGEEQPEKTRKSPQIEAGAASKSEKNVSKNKADTKKNESSSAPKNKEKGMAVDEPQRKKIRLASAASQQDAAVPQKSRRKAAVPEKAPKTKTKAQQATSNKDASKKKTPASARKKKEGDAAEKTKAKKAPKK